MPSTLSTLPPGPVVFSSTRENETPARASRRTSRSRVTSHEPESGAACDFCRFGASPRPDSRFPPTPVGLSLAVALAVSRRLLPLALRLWLHCSTPPVEAVTRRNKHWSRIYYSTVRRRSPPKLVLPASFGTGRQLVSLWSISTTTTTEEASESAIIASGQRSPWR